MISHEGGAEAPEKIHCNSMWVCGELILGACEQTGMPRNRSPSTTPYVDASRLDEYFPAQQLAMRAFQESVNRRSAHASIICEQKTTKNCAAIPLMRPSGSHPSELSLVPPCSDPSQKPGRPSVGLRGSSRFNAAERVPPPHPHTHQSAYPPDAQPQLAWTNSLTLTPTPEPLNPKP